MYVYKQDLTSKKIQWSISYKTKQILIIWSAIVCRSTKTMETRNHSLLIMIFCITTFTQSYTTVALPDNVLVNEQNKKNAFH